MKSRKIMKALFAGFLAVALAACCLPTLPALEAAAQTEETDVQANASSTPLDNWTVGKKVFSADFTDATEAGIAIPDTWDATTSTSTFNSSLCWNGTAATTAPVFKTVDDVNGLYLQPAGTSYADHILILPDFGTENYAITVKVKALTANGSFGIATGLPASPANAAAFTSGCISTHNDSSVVLKHKTKNTNAVTYASFAKADWSIVQNGEYTLQTIYYNGVTTFYVDGKLVGEAAGSTSSDLLSRAGLYTCGGTWFVTDIQVCTVTEKAADDWFAGSPLFKANFSSATAEGAAIPGDWDATTSTADAYTNLIWNGAKTQVETTNIAFKTVDGVSGLYLNPAQTAGYADHILVLPALESEEYIMTVKVKAQLTKGTFGLVTGLPTDYASADSFVAGSICVHQTPHVLQKKHVRTTTSNGKDVQKISVAEDISITTDTEYTLKAVHTDGVTYFYLDDAFIAQIKDNATNETLNRVGLYTCGGSWFVSDITVAEIITDSALSMPGASIRYANPDGTYLDKDESGIRFGTVLDKSSRLYQFACGDEAYTYSEDASLKMGTVLLPTDMLEEDELLTAETPLALDVVTEKIYSQDEDTLMWMTTLLDIPQSQLGRAYTARSYVEYTTQSGTTTRIYTNQISASPAHVANLFYPEATDVVKAKLDAIYEGVEGYMGKEVQKVTFSLFADLHYKEDMYMSSVADVQTILKRADENNADFVVHMGDFSNDYSGSPELFDTYMNNLYELPVYGIYGNHELETSGNTMEVVTPKLTNQTNVVWGTEDGTIGDGSIGYYYYEVNGFRFICLDTNYSQDADGNWVHNAENSYGAASGNTNPNHLGDTQKEWLKDVLNDAATSGTPCVVFAHHSFSGVWTSTDEAAEIRAIFNAANEKQAGTVMMVLNGHLHTNHSQVIDDILYVDVNTVRNGYWQGTTAQHYTDEQTFEQVKYDADGVVTSTTKCKLSELSMAAQTWFFEDALNAVVTVYNTGDIQIEGVESDWIYDVVPSGAGTNGVEPRITSQNVSLW